MKKLLALLLAIVLLVCIIPVSAYATTDEVTAPTVACLPGNGFEVNCTHIWTAKYGEIAPTCEVGGWAFWYCGNCGIWLTWWPLCPTGHTEVIDEAVAPTCTETGLTEGSHCAVCEKVLVAQDVVDALGHNMDGADHKEPTCTEDGYKAHKCTRCGYREEYTVDKLGHSYTVVEHTDPTCTEPGYTKTKCERCGEPSPFSAEHPATGHDWDEGVVTREPTVELEGEITYTCKNNAEHKKYDAIDKLVVEEEEETPKVEEETPKEEEETPKVEETPKEETPKVEETPKEETPKEETPKVEQEATPDKNLDEVPKTGDNSGLILATMSGVAMLSAAAYVFGKKRSVR